MADAESKCTQISFMQKIQASNLYLYCLWCLRMRISLVSASKLHSTEVWQLSSPPLQSNKTLHGAMSLKNNLRKMTLLIKALAKKRI